MSGAVFHQPLFERIDGDKRERILAVAVEEFSSFGFANANVNLIASRVGVSVGSLYKYFATKEDLYLTVVNLAFSRLEEALEPILASDMSALAKIRAIIDVLFEKTSEQQSLTRLYNRFTVESGSELTKQLALRLETITSHAYSALMSQARVEGLMDADADERAFAFCMDNVLLGTQFSLASEYYRDRLEIYLGDDIAQRQAFLKDQIFHFVENALTRRNDKIS